MSVPFFIATHPVIYVSTLTFPHELDVFGSLDPLEPVKSH